MCFKQIFYRLPLLQLLVQYKTLRNKDIVFRNVFNMYFTGGIQTNLVLITGRLKDM